MVRGGAPHFQLRVYRVENNFSSYAHMAVSRPIRSMLAAVSSPELPHSASGFSVRPARMCFKCNSDTRNICCAVILGIIAYRSGWLETIPALTVRVWTMIAVAMILILPAFVVLGGALSGDIGSFQAGFPGRR